MEGIEFKRNWLPQWRMDGGIYFVTWRLCNPADSLSPAERSIVAAALRQYRDEQYRLSIFVVMDNHVHALLQTLPGQDLSRCLQLLKGSTAREINRLRGRQGSLWQKDSYTELLGNDRAIASRREYIYNNPQRKWPGTERYEWVEWFE